MTAAEAFEVWWSTNETSPEYSKPDARAAWLAAWSQAVQQTREAVIGEFIASCEVADNPATEQHILGVAETIRRAQEPTP